MCGLYCSCHVGGGFGICTWVWSWLRSISCVDGGTAVCSLRPSCRRARFLLLSADLFGSYPYLFCFFSLYRFNQSFAPSSVKKFCCKMRFEEPSWRITSYMYDKEDLLELSIESVCISVSCTNPHIANHRCFQHFYCMFWHRILPWLLYTAKLRFPTKW